jgi:hypothetical protein
LWGWGAAPTRERLAETVPCAGLLSLRISVLSAVCGERPAYAVASVWTVACLANA